MQQKESIDTLFRGIATIEARDAFDRSREQGGALISISDILSEL